MYCADLASTNSREPIKLLAFVFVVVLASAYKCTQCPSREELTGHMDA